MLTPKNETTCRHLPARSDSYPALDVYISPRELTLRWRCSRSGVDVIARREGFTKVCLGRGRNGMVRYLLQEVEALESRRVTLTEFEK